MYGKQKKTSRKQDPARYFDLGKSTQKQKTKTKRSANKFKSLIKKKKEKDVREMMLKAQKFPQKYENTVFLADRGHVGTIYDQKAKKRRKEEQVRLNNISNIYDIHSPDKLERFLNEDRKMTGQRKKRYLELIRNKQEGKKDRSIHLKFYKHGADQKRLWPKVHDDRIELLSQNEHKRMMLSKQKMKEANSRSANADLENGNYNYLSKLGFT